MTDLLAIRRMLDDGTPIPPWIVRGLVERCEKLEADAASFQRLATQHLARRLVDRIDYEILSDAARAWADAIDRCDGIAAAEEALREAVRGL